MGFLGMNQLSFMAPSVLWALLLLPLIYFLIRLLPPRPQTVNFPAIGLLKQLEKRLPPPRTPPWWLMLLRLGAVALLITAMAGPMLQKDTTTFEKTPMVIFVSNGWEAAENWQDISQRLRLILTKARAENVQVAVIGTADKFDASELALKDAGAALAALPELNPRPWPDKAKEVAQAVAAAANGRGNYQPIWLSSGMMAPKERRGFIAAAESLGRTRVFLPERAQLPVTLTSATPRQGGFDVTLYRADDAGERDFSVSLRDMQGNFITRQGGSFKKSSRQAALRLTLPKQLKTPGYFTLDGQNHLGAWNGLSSVAGLPKIGVIGGKGTDFPLLNGFYYLERALSPTLTPDSLDVTTKGQGYDVLFVASQPTDPEALKRWAEGGGVLVTFADSWLQENTEAAPLLPVKLRPYPRQLEGALSWTGALGLKDIGGSTPLAGVADLSEGSDVKIRQQFLPQTGANLSENTWVSLTDDTPLVSGEKLGNGWRVLVHVPPVATWSNLPASGFFVQLLEGLAALSEPKEAENTASSFPLPAYKLLTAQTQLVSPQRGEMLKAAGEAVTAENPPGLYGNSQRPFIHQLGAEQRKLAPVTPSSLAGLTATYYSQAEAQKPLQMPLLLLALVLLVADSLLRLNLIHKRLLAKAAATGALLVACALPLPAQAQGPMPEGAQRVQFAFIDSGNQTLNSLSERGLISLSQVIANRTTVEPAPPKKLNPAVDELGFYPIIFWPVTPDLGTISQKAADNLRLYIENGGLLLIDGLTDLGPAPQAVQVIMNQILPFPLKPLRDDHVLNRSYYLLQGQTPGRQTGTLWLEQSHRLSRVLVGAHDWLGAWAHSAAGQPLRPIPGGGEQRRVKAFQFGVNVVMYALLGDYKADQTHVETLLKRMEER